MKKGFTMIELIFVIVILGILAAVAIPRLAATRDDATLAGIKTDVATALQAVPAWYQGQKDARIAEGVQLDTSKWEQSATGTEQYDWKVDGSTCVTIAVYDMNMTAVPPTALHVATTTDINSSNGYWIATDGVPVLRVIKPASTTGICSTLWGDMGLTEQNVTMAGRKVQW
jgi:general secretion pathway protein G